MAMLLLAKERAFSVALKGEGAQDLGRSYGELISDVCADVERLGLSWQGGGGSRYVFVSVRGGTP